VDQLFYAHKIDTVVHFAAETHVDRSIFNLRNIFSYKCCRHLHIIRSRSSVLAF
jgi:dTDP-D-glucose 4,6-dehydratase